MARVVEEEAKRTPGKKQLAMMAFARALRTIPTIIADNAGYDSAELVSNLVAEHNQGSFRAGLGGSFLSLFVCIPSVYLTMVDSCVSLI